MIFPTFPQLLATRQKLGGLFTYKIYGGHRMTFIADPAVWRLVFYAKGSQDTKLESEKLAYVWFGIDKQVCLVLRCVSYHLGCVFRSRWTAPIQASRQPERPCITSK